MRLVAAPRRARARARPRPRPQPRPRRQRDCTCVLHFSKFISLPSSAKQQREMTRNGTRR